MKAVLAAALMFTRGFGTVRLDQPSRKAALKCGAIRK